MKLLSVLIIAALALPAAPAVADTATAYPPCFPSGQRSS